MKITKGLKTQIDVMETMTEPGAVKALKSKDPQDVALALGFLAVQEHTSPEILSEVNRVLGEAVKALNGKDNEFFSRAAGIQPNRAREVPAATDVCESALYCIERHSSFIVKNCSRKESKETIGLVVSLLADSKATAFQDVDNALHRTNIALMAEFAGLQGAEGKKKMRVDEVPMEQLSPGC